MPSSSASRAICSVLRLKAKDPSLMSTAMCFFTLNRLMTAPTARPISALPRNVPAATRIEIGASSASVATSNSSRLRRRSSATSGSRQMTSRGSVVAEKDGVAFALRECAL